MDLTQYPKCTFHYANTEVHTQEIPLHPVRLKNFYTNEDLLKHCLKSLTQNQRVWNVVYGAVVRKIKFVAKSR